MKCQGIAGGAFEKLSLRAFSQYVNIWNGNQWILKPVEESEISSAWNAHLIQVKEVLAYKPPPREEKFTIKTDYFNTVGEDGELVLHYQDPEFVQWHPAYQARLEREQREHAERERIKQEERERREHEEREQRERESRAERERVEKQHREAAQQARQDAERLDNKRREQERQQKQQNEQSGAPALEEQNPKQSADEAGSKRRKSIASSPAPKNDSGSMGKAAVVITIVAAAAWYTIQGQHEPVTQPVAVAAVSVPSASPAAVVVQPEIRPILHEIAETRDSDFGDLPVIASITDSDHYDLVPDAATDDIATDVVEQSPSAATTGTEIVLTSTNALSQVTEPFVEKPKNTTSSKAILYTIGGVLISVPIAIFLISGKNK